MWCYEEIFVFGINYTYIDEMERWVHLWDLYFFLSSLPVNRMNLFCWFVWRRNARGSFVHWLNIQRMLPIRMKIRKLLVYQLIDRFYLSLWNLKWKLSLVPDTGIGRVELRNGRNLEIVDEILIAMRVDWVYSNNLIKLVCSHGIFEYKFTAQSRVHLESSHLISFEIRDHHQFCDALCMFERVTAFNSSAELISFSFF